MHCSYFFSGKKFSQCVLTQYTAHPVNHVLSHLIPSYIPASFLARSPIPSVVVIPWSSPYPSHDLEKPAHNLASPQ